MSQPKRFDVDLVVTCFERTYRKVLRPGFVIGIATQNQFAFKAKTVLINNVESRATVEELARQLVARGEIDRFDFVEDHIEAAYRRHRLSRKTLGRIHYYSDHFLVAPLLPGSPYLLHWDPDVVLENPGDWLTPCLELMEKDARIATANPNWESDSLARETVEWRGEVALGYGFSDQIFLSRRSELAGADYHRFTLPMLRYPLVHIGRIYEARMDSYMRTERRMRATYRPLRYLHRGEASSSSTFKETSFEKLQRIVVRSVLATVNLLPWKPPHWRM